MIGALFVLLIAGCGTEGFVDIVETRPDAPAIEPRTECVVQTGRYSDTSNPHVETCSSLEPVFYPPAGGPHYPVWADFGTYTEQVPYGFLIHSMEHGALILVHNCPNGCPEVLAAFEDIRATTVDPLCIDHPNGNRIIVQPDPDLQVPIAALSWGFEYLATCLDEPSLWAFVSDHYGRNESPEHLCHAGSSTVACP